MVTNLPANAGDTGDLGSTPGSGRSPGGGKGNPFPYSCQGNPMDRGAWQAIVHGVAKSRTQLSMHTHTHTHTHSCTCWSFNGPEPAGSENKRKRLMISPGFRGEPVEPCS